MAAPDDRKYSKTHEWAQAQGRRVRVGISEYAADQLGDIVYVDLPQIGDQVDRGAVLGELESVKAVAEVNAPIAGRVVEVNAELADAVELVNQEPYGRGWICAIEATNLADLDSLLDAGEYTELTAGEGAP